MTVGWAALLLLALVLLGNLVAVLAADRLDRRKQFRDLASRQKR